MQERLRKIKELAGKPLTNDRTTKRVEIIMLKFREHPTVINESVTRIINNTSWPFKLTIFDNRLNSANTSKIWNKLIKQSTCDYVCIIDSDAFVPVKMSKARRCWLTRMMESIEETGVVVPMGDVVGGENRSDVAMPYPSTTRQRGIWSGFCFLVKKKVFDTVGWFDEDFYIYGQDSEFAHRVMRRLGGAVYRTDVLVRHLGSYSFKKEEKESKLDRDADKMYAASLFRLKTTNKL